ncbi:polysaccharide export protein [Candidatus Vecturithrix granuli]|uniref:Polysaccharide export protein n=1 Tax=Vecturithrix granuli TaxID=1499967 RepID=A0A0S6WA89_VECG1|nr:polysaccharide export protein [Candidatus Vecturithrix granuli]
MNMMSHFPFKCIQGMMLDAIHILRWWSVVVVIFLGNSTIVAQEVPVPRGLPGQVASISEREYVIGTYDQLVMSEWQSQSFSTQGTVRTDGKITIAYLGDIQAAGLKVSTFRKNLEVLLQKYLKQPMVNLTVITSGRIRITIMIEGESSQETELPRETKLIEVLRQLVPNLRQIQPSPNLANIKVIGSDQEEYTINGLELLAGKSLHANIRLEWGDQIYIPSQIQPTPVPDARPSRPMIAPGQQAIFSVQGFEEFLQQYPPEIQEKLKALATQPDEQSYMIDLTTLSEEQRQALGDEVLQALELYAVASQQQFTHFTNITLAAISIHLAAKENVEAYLAIPNPVPGQLPTIQRFQEGDIVQQGEVPEEQIVLKEIQDTLNLVILEKGEEQQALQLPPALTQAKLSGIINVGNTKKASFSNLQALNESNRPMKQRMFAEHDKIEEAVEIVKITNEWVLLQKDEQTQLMLLRDSLDRVVPTPIPAPLPSSLEEIPESEFPNIPQETKAVPPSTL